VTKASGSSSGSINMGFSAPATALDYLAAGEVLTLTYTVDLNDGDGGITPQTFVVNITGTTELPILTAFAAPIVATNEDTTVEITLADLIAQGNEADVDGTVISFVIKSVVSGTLKIGPDAASAQAWNATTNATVDTDKKAYWTPVANANGALNAFTAVAKDNDGAESVTAITAIVTVAAINDTPTITTTNLVTTYTDTMATDTFSNSTGTLIANDVDVSTTLSYGISDGIVSGSTITKVGTYGTLSINSTTGAYTYSPNSNAINALSTTATDAFTLTVSDGSLSTTTTYIATLIGSNEVSQGVNFAWYDYTNNPISSQGVSLRSNTTQSTFYVDDAVLSSVTGRSDDVYIEARASILIPDVAGSSSFTLNLRTYSDDGVQVWINGQSVISNRTDHGPTYNYGTINVTDNSLVPIVVQWWENGGGALLDLEWSPLSGGSSYVRIPNTALYAVGTATPLILDLNHDSVRTLGTDAGLQYDLTGSGLRASVGWSAPEDGFLVRDINHDGSINDGTEMFGEATVLANGERAQDGFEALSDLDTNQDGMINSQDQAFNSLAIWRDVNTDGITDAGELLTLAQHDIASLNLSYTESDRVDNGNQLRLVSNYTTTDGTSYEMVDVWLTTNYQTNMSETPAVPAVLEKLTDTAGQDHFEVSQLVFHEQYSQRAMESALDYYLDVQDASELSQAIFEIHGGDSTKPSEVHLAGLLQNYANDETDQDQLNFTGFSDSATIETRNIMTSSNKEFAYTYVSDQQIDKNVYTGLLIDLGLNTTPNHDEILHLEIKKN
jgi:VCBS repeat-containing protein